MTQERRIHIIYMAAGNSERFEGNKLLYELDGKALFRYGLEALLKVQECNSNVDITVVTQYDVIMEWLRSEGIKVVYSSNSRYGVSFTIKAGLRSIEKLAPGDYVMFVAADQPWLSAETVNKLIEAIHDESEIVAVSHNGRMGNPVAFSERLAGELMQLYGDEGGKTLFKHFKVEFIDISNDYELADVDEKNDLMYNKQAFL